MQTQFFFYGSLRDPLILEAVLGRGLAHLTFGTARMPGHRVERAEGYSFPLLISSKHGHAMGSIVEGLTASDQARIAYFEDSEYELREYEVLTSNRAQRAFAYAATGKLNSSGEPWDLAQFQAQDRALLLAVTRFVMTEHYGVTPQAAMERMWSSIRDRIAREMGHADKP